MAATRLPSFALFWSGDAYTAGKDRIMGRQAAGIGFAKAVANGSPDQLFAVARLPRGARDLEAQLRSYGNRYTRVHWLPQTQVAKLAEAGLFYRPDPGIAAECWRRRAVVAPTDYSLCGVTHTISSHAAMEHIAALVTDPVEEWDALICTSKAVRDGVEFILDAATEHLGDRLGATTFPRPQLPIIPLGVHCGDFVCSEEDRQTSRKLLRIEPDEVAVLFVGRLSFHAKAHPMPMYLGLQEAATGRRVVLIQAGWFANRDVENVFREEARTFCPAVRCLFVDGRDAKKRREAWAAADIFTSLADNYQETFGLTPVEAMAAGLPSVVSDWNGYRDTIRDGVDGFRIRTTAMPAGTGGTLATRYDVGIDDYDHFSLHSSQLVAVDCEHARNAYAQLINNQELRLTMGRAAQERARAEFDWSVVMSRYSELWQELGKIRKHKSSRPAPRRSPVRPDPLSLFAGYPTEVIRTTTMVQLRSGYNIQAVLDRLALGSVRPGRSFLPNGKTFEAVLDCLSGGKWVQLRAILPPQGQSSAGVAAAVVWLHKMGVVRCRPAEAGAEIFPAM